MRLEFSGKNLSITDALRNKAEKKIAKLERFTGSIVSAHASFEVERHLHRVTLMVHCGHDRIYKAKGLAEDMYMAINDAVDAIEQQSKKDKDKRMAGRSKTVAPAAPKEAEEEDEEEPAKTKRKVPRVRRRDDLFSPKPMSLPDAALRLAEQDDPVVVFQDPATGRLCVLFRDKAGRISLVEPPNKR
ncbi:MAG: ribosome hibernation-promoting factor, HPF/YfiA family [Acidobacteriota bacterium]